MKLNYPITIKVLFDITLTLIILLLCLPIMLVLCGILIISHKKLDIFFTQSRLGKNKNIFKVIKFKTMSEERDASGNLLPDDLRLTKVGKFFRFTSLDELPQIFNVLKGDMSLIGPRPLLPKYSPLYNEWQARRNEVKPGITGWTQVNGRNAISWKEKFELDVWYVDNISLSLDMKILWMTFIKVIKKEGISAEGSVSGTPFTGNDDEIRT